MKKMNRSQSSHRQAKTLPSEAYEDRLMNKYPLLHYMNKNQLINSKFIDADKQNNSLFQSVSEKSFSGRSREQISQFDLGREPKNQSKIYNYSESYSQSIIQSLRNLIKQKDRELQYFKQRYNSRNDDMDSMSSQISSKLQRDNKEKNMYIRQINAKGIEINNLKERVKIHKAEIQTLRLCINEKEQVLKQYEERMGQVDMKKKRVQHYQYQMKQYQQTLKQLESKAHKLKEQTQNKDSIIHEKAKSILSLQQTIGSYQDKLRSIQESLMNLAEDRKGVKDKNEQLLRQCQNWRESYDQQLKRNQAFQDYEIKLKTCQGMLEHANRRIMQLTSLNEKIKIAAITNQKSLQKYKQIQKEVGVLKRGIKDKQERIIQLHNKQKGLRLLQQSILKVRKQKDQCLMRLQEKIKECKCFSLLFEQQQDRANCLEQDLREIEQSNTRIKQKGQKMQILMRENNRLTSNLHQKVNQIQRLQIKINNLDIKYNEKSNQTAKMKSVIDQKYQEINEFKLQVQDLRQRYEIQTNNRIVNEDKVLRCSQEIYALKCNIAKLQSQNKEALQQLEKVQSQHQKAVNNFKELTTEMMQDKQQSEDLLEQAVSRIKFLQNQVQYLKSQFEEAENNEKTHKMQIANFQLQFIELRQKNKNLQNEKHQILGKCQQLHQIHSFVMKLKTI